MFLLGHAALEVLLLKYEVNFDPSSLTCREQCLQHQPERGQNLPQTAQLRVCQMAFRNGPQNGVN